MLLECSHGTWYDVVYVNGKLLENNIMQDVAYWCVQQESILGVPWKIDGRHIAVGVNNMRLNAPQMFPWD